MNHVGVVIADRGSAIVTVDHGPEEDLLATGIERLPFSLSAVADRVSQLDTEMADVRFVIDASGLGGAVWAALGRPEDEDRWQLYEGKGLERQALVDTLVVAIHEDRFHFAPNLAEQTAMSKAMQAYRRQVKEDGLIGSELVVALCLAVLPQPALDEVHFYQL